MLLRVGAGTGRGHGGGVRRPAAREQEMQGGGRRSVGRSGTCAGGRRSRPSATSRTTVGVLQQLLQMGRHVALEHGTGEKLDEVAVRRWECLAGIRACTACIVSW
jgi:hypothetical protein